MTSNSERTDPKPASDRIYYFVYSLIRLLVRLLWRHDVEGRENIPASGPYLLTFNHLGVFDTAAVLLSSPHRIIAFGADKWRRRPGARQLFEMMGVIWVARGEADLDAVKAALGALKSGRVVGIAPEGTRSPTGALIAGKPGAAYLADRARVPIVPLALIGTEKVGPAWKRLRRPRVKCIVGQPFFLPGDGRVRGPRLDEFTELIMCKLAAMLPPEYRGAYADHPLLREMLAAQPGQGAG